MADKHEDAPPHQHRYRLLLDQLDASEALELHEWDANCDPDGESMTALIAALREVADTLDIQHRQHLAERN